MVQMQTKGELSKFSCWPNSHKTCVLGNSQNRHTFVKRTGTGTVTFAAVLGSKIGSVGTCLKWVQSIYDSLESESRTWLSPQGAFLSASPSRTWSAPPPAPPWIVYKKGFNKYMIQANEYMIQINEYMIQVLEYRYHRISIQPEGKRGGGGALLPSNWT